MRSSAVFVVAGLMFVAPAFAQDCSNASTQAQMSACAGEEFKKADSELNGLYSRVKDRLKADRTKTELLTKAQRAWVSFRDAECGFVGSAAEGGSIQPMIIAICKDEITQDRNSKLGEYLKCEEGDGSCPVPSAD